MVKIKILSQIPQLLLEISDPFFLDPIMLNVCKHCLQNSYGCEQALVTYQKQVCGSNDCQLHMLQTTLKR